MLTGLKLYLITGEAWVMFGLWCDPAAQASMRRVGLGVGILALTLVMLTWPRVFLHR
jgi:hypothetical protein